MRKPVVLLAILALGVGAVVASPTAPSATATSAGVSFSADDLPTWQTNGIVWGMASVRGRVVAGGTFSQIKPPTDGVGTPRAQNALVILNAETGEPDSCQFPVSLVGGTPTVRAVAASADGNTVYLGGNFSSVGGVTVSRVAQIDPVACTVRPLRVPSVSSFVYGLVATPTTLYLAGEFTSVDGQTRNRFAAVNSTSGALLPWNPSADRIGRAVAVSPDGSKVAVGGDFTQVNAQASHSIAVVDATSGATVRSYPGFVHPNSVTKSLWSDGTQFYAGNEGTGGNVFDGRFAVSWDTLNQTWRDLCLGATQAVLTYQGTLYSASHAHNCSPNANEQFQDGRRNFFMAQSTQSPSTLLGWFPTASDGIGEGIGPRALTVGVGTTTGKAYLWSGGEFTIINGRAQQSLTRFGPDDVGAPPVPVVQAESVTSTSVQIRFRTVVDRDDSVITYRLYRDGSSTPIWTGTASSMWWSRPQVTVVDAAVAAGSSHSYRVTASDGRNTSALSAPVSAVAVAKGVDYPTTVIQDGAQLYWRFDETGTIAASGTWVRDRAGATTSGLSGLYQNGVTLGGAGAIVGDANTSAQFDGSSGYVWNDQQKVGPTNYSVETWIRTSTTRGGKIIGYGNGRPRTDTYAPLQSTSYDKHVYMDNTGRLNFGVKTATTQVIRSAAAYNDNAWHHVVATQGSNGMRMYVDGTLVGQNAVTGSERFFGNWHVGGDRISGWPNSPSSAYFAGQIDETAVYGSVLTPQQVSAHNTLARSGVVPPPPADVVAPSVPGGVSASVSGSAVSVGWSASSDAVGVVGYRVYRGTSAGFVVDAASRVAEVGGTSFVDAGRPAGTYFYRVDAVDAAGNVSAASTPPASATVAAVPVVVTVSPTDDARVVQITPTTNYGADTQLSATGSTGASPAESFLRFNLPSAPAGTTLTGATLQVRTSGDPSGGSADSFALTVVTGDWLQGTVTWNTRPTGPGPALGSLTGATAVNTPYSVGLSASQLAALQGSPISVSVVGSGTDNLRLWSNEAPSTAYRPMLVLTYTPV